MNRLERLDDLYEVLQAAADASQAVIWTALPGIIESFDAVKMTCKVKVAVRALSKTDNKYSYVSMPPLLDCPVVFPNGGGFVLTFPIAPGDECLVVFSSRCIDSWWQLGGEQNPFEYRMHDLSDGFVLPGPRSQPRKVSGISTTSVQLRNEDGTSFIEINPDGDITLDTPTVVNINAPSINLTGDVAVTGASLTHNGVSVGDTHKHSGVDAGGDNTGDPIP